MTVLVAYIPSPLGDAALDRAIEEARAHKTDLVVLNAARGEALVERRRLYNDDAARLTAKLDASGVAYTLRRENHPAHPAEQILAVAREVEAQMIVIGLRPRSATGKLIFGSSAQQILMDADCAVLAVKAPKGQTG